jgi:hypothetical protein
VAALHLLEGGRCSGAAPAEGDAAVLHRVREAEEPVPGGVHGGMCIWPYRRRNDLRGMCIQEVTHGLPSGLGQPLLFSLPFFLVFLFLFSFFYSNLRETVS